MDVVARAVQAVRAGIGALVGSDALAAAVAAEPTPELICAIAITTTCAPDSGATVAVTAPGRTAVPGFPTTDLADAHGPWQQALDAAADLGAPLHLYEQRVMDHGLLVPAALLDTCDWPTLWRRAHR